MYTEIKAFSRNLTERHVSANLLARVKDGLMWIGNTREMHYLKTIAAIHTRRQLSRETTDERYRLYENLSSGIRHAKLTMGYVGVYKVARDLVICERRLHDLCSRIHHLLCIDVPEMVAAPKRPKIEFTVNEYYRQCHNVQRICITTEYIIFSFFSWRQCHRIF